MYQYHDNALVYYGVVVKSITLRVTDKNQWTILSTVHYYIKKGGSYLNGITAPQNSLLWYYNCTVIFLRIINVCTYGVLKD
jgi:hypothetical protein